MHFKNQYRIKQDLTEFTVQTFFYNFFSFKKNNFLIYRYLGSSYKGARRGEKQDDPIALL